MLKPPRDSKSSFKKFKTVEKLSKNKNLLDQAIKLVKIMIMNDDVMQLMILQ